MMIGMAVSLLGCHSSLVRMTRAMSRGVEFRIATPDLAGEIMRFSQNIIDTDDSPMLDSFRRDLSDSRDSMLGRNSMVTFVILVDDHLAGRCEVNLEPAVGDIDGYGDMAASLLASRRCGVLCGTLVSPEYRGRGLQLASMRHRIDYLSKRGYDYAFTAALPDNEHSIRNITLAGFTRIGVKHMDELDSDAILFGEPICKSIVP